MLKQILNEKIKEHSTQTVIESKKTTVSLDRDPEIEMALPMLADEDEHDDYRVILGQLKKRNSKAFKKIINFD